MDRIIGIDYGRKRVGVAVSDRWVFLPQPWTRFQLQR